MAQASEPSREPTESSRPTGPTVGEASGSYRYNVAVHNPIYDDSVREIGE